MNNDSSLLTKTDHCQFYDKGLLVDEHNEWHDLLKFLYKNSVGKLVRRLLVGTRYASSLAALYQCSSLSCSKIVPFIKKHNINMNDFIMPAQGYTSFNEFFIRTLKPGARIIDERPEMVVSPADGKVLIIADITEQAEFFIKGKPFDLVTLVQNALLAHEYKHGILMIFRLAPYDYHRFHFPVAGVPDQVKVMQGTYESVNPMVYKTGVQPLTENVRHLISLKTEQYGDVLIMPVGALFVGSIVQTYQANKQYRKGDEVGFFQFGGSTVAVLFKPGVIQPRKDIMQHSLQGIETAIKMGEAVTE